MEVLKALIKQPYWVISLVLGAAFLALTCVTVDKDSHWSTHPPGTLWLAIVGIALLVLSVAGFGLTLWRRGDLGAGGLEGLDPKRVKKCGTALCTNVAGCEIRVVKGGLRNINNRWVQRSCFPVMNTSMTGVWAIPGAHWVPMRIGCSKAMLESLPL
jgi:hypothetical protein